MAKISSRAPHPPWACSGGKQRPRRQREEKPGAGRHHDGVGWKQNESREARPDVHRQILPYCNGSRGRKLRACTVLYGTGKRQNPCSKKGSISWFPPSQPTPPPGARSDTTPPLTAPPRCAVFQEVTYLPTSIFVRSTCSLKHNENSLPDQFVSEVSWLPAPL